MSDAVRSSYRRQHSAAHHDRNCCLSLPLFDTRTSKVGNTEALKKKDNDADAMRKKQEAADAKKKEQEAELAKQKAGGQIVKAKIPL